MALHVRHTDTRPAGFTVHSHTRTGTGRDDRAACCSPCRLAVGVCVYSRRRPAGPVRARAENQRPRPAPFFSRSRRRLTRAAAGPARTACAGRDHRDLTRAS